MSHRLSASGLVLLLALAATPVLAQADHVDANGMPTDHSTPAEQAQTRGLNNQIQNNNQAADANYQAQLDATNAQAATNDAQYQAQQQQYQDQLQNNQAAQRDYQDRSAAYQNLRARYAAERAAYHREVWPTRYRDWHLQSDARLVGSRVEILSGARVGTVDGVARTAGGRIEALYVTLDGGKQVWIDEADIRFNRGNSVVMTNLNRADLHQMADERL